MKKYIYCILMLAIMVIVATAPVEARKPRIQQTPAQTTPPKPNKPSKPSTPSKPNKPSKPSNSSAGPSIPSILGNMGRAQSQNDSRSNETFTVGGVSFTMIAVKGGTFDMGATPEQHDPDIDEKPVHKVTLSDYSIGQTEVTQALWRAVMGNNPSNLKGDNLPVEQVSWDDCKEFIRRLNSMTGRNFRLPTEAEWEYAARGGRKSTGYQYSGSNSIDAVAWYDGNSGDKTHPVATKRPNELGIYDMTGNVFEWCEDRYDSYSNGSVTNPTGPSTDSYDSSRVIRGGGWGYVASVCRVACRLSRHQGYRYDDCLGLRLAL